MEIWLNNENDKIRFPILPTSFKIVTAQQNTAQNVHRKGEINLLGEKSLETVELTSFFPAKEYSFCQYKGFNTNPYFYANKIKDWKNKKVTPRLLITGEPDINMCVSIEAFEYGEDDASGDVTFTISLKEYVTVEYSKPKKNTKAGKKVKKKKIKKKRSSKAKKTTKYTVKKVIHCGELRRKKQGSPRIGKRFTRKINQ